MVKWARPLAAKKSPMSPKVPGKGYGTKPKSLPMPPVRGPGKSNSLPAKKK